MVAVPIRPGSKVAGLLEVFSPQPYAFNANDIGALQQLTGSILPTLIPIATGHDSAAPVQRAFSPRTSPAPIEPRPAEVRTVSAARPVTAVKPSGQRRWHKSSARVRDRHFCFRSVMAGCALDLKPDALVQRVRSSASSASFFEISPPAGPANDLASLRKVAERGDPAAQFALGARYATGEEVKQDYTEAVNWFTLAAEQGHILSQATLGAYYWAGRGVPQDLTKAYYWSVLAQAGGDQASKYRVAVLASRMSRSQVLAAQQQANDWLRNFAGRSPLLLPGRLSRSRIEAEVYSVPTLRDIVNQNVREGDLYEKLDRNRVRCLCLRPLLSHSRWSARSLQSALQPGRHALRALGLRRRRAVRSHREETVLPCLSGRAGLQLRNAGLRSALWLLPELGDFAGAARSGCGVGAACRPRPRPWCRMRCVRERRSWSAPTTSR